MGTRQSQSLELEPESAPTRRRPGPPPQYIDIDRLKNADGICAIISQRLANGVITFGIFKEFTRDGQAERTSFIAENLRESYGSMFQLLTERIEKIRDKDGKLLEELQRKALEQLDDADREHALRALKLKPLAGARK